MNEILFVVGNRPVHAFELLLGLSTLALVLLFSVVIVLWRTSRRRAQEAEEMRIRTDEQEQRLTDLIRAQAEASGRMQTLAEVLGGRQAELQQAVTERLDSVSHRLGEGMMKSARATHESLTQLHERLGIVDAAQARLVELSSQVVTLQDVLSNKQARGAFGQVQMEGIIADGLPKEVFAFQHTLSNRTKPDCVVFLPGQAPALVIDAKFPLESIIAFREAKSEAALHAACQRVRQDVTKHIHDIASRYFIPGETQDIALMFVPSESIYADLYESFDDLIQKAFRQRVMLVSPSLLMLAVKVIQTIVRDERMREQTELVRTEVEKLMDNVRRLHERALKLQSHFSHASESIANVAISSEKILKHGSKIQALELDDLKSSRDSDQTPFKLGAAE